METAVLTLTDFLLARIAEDEEQFASADRLGIIQMHGSRLFSGVGNHPAATDARLRAECEAKRQIVKWANLPCQTFDPEDVLGFLALPYADHPDYREEWRA